MEISIPIQIVAALLGLSTLALFWLSNHHASPVMAIFARWSRWAFIAVVGGIGLYLTGWTGYPLKVLIPVAFLLWFLLETAYIWLAIAAVNHSHLPLFPKFEESERQNEWPAHPRFIALRAWLRKEGFELEQALTAKLDPHNLIRNFVYMNSARTWRMSILLLPNARGNMMATCVVDSMLQDERRLITDNVFLPFGGFYPENWELERHPWIRSPQRLWKRHAERIDAAGTPLKPFILAPFSQLKADQRMVERINRELGFLSDSSEEEEAGRITPAGRARIWQELWMLAYMGKPFRYQ